MDIKKIVKELLIRLGIITEKFTGEIVINFNQGGVRDVIKKEKVV